MTEYDIIWYNICYYRILYYIRFQYTISAYFFIIFYSMFYIINLRQMLPPFCGKRLVPSERGEAQPLPHRGDDPPQRERTISFRETPPLPRWYTTTPIGEVPPFEMNRIGYNII